jgi:NAD(P)-dependent dehydrogenase (short-subunit alcohol dehydrogenase family)
MSDASRTVLTTGANSGIGLATTIELARRGFRAVGSVRSTSKARRVREAAREAGVDVETVLLDVTDASACRRVIDRLRPWGLVNNAGSSFSGAIEDVSDADARAALETMVLAPMRLARLAIPHMRAIGGGRIVQVSSIYGLTTTPLTGWYQGSKHAIEGLSDALRMEVAKDDIAVVLIEPGSVDTGIWDSADADFAKGSSSRYRGAYQRTKQGIELSRRFMASPQNVAKDIARALTARSPRPRYLVGADAQLMAALDAMTPTQLKDRIIRLTLGL